MRNLKILRDEKLVNGLSLSDTADMSFCGGCAKGKQKRNAFPKNEATRSSELLGIVHSDVCGPMRSASLGGNRYFVTFIDDKSRFVAVYFMKSKDHVLQKFKECEAMVTNVTGKKIKIFRSDNGGEYNSREFNDFLVSKGTGKRRSIPRTPQQNGIAERMNRTIQESARSMLHDAELPYTFWRAAVATTVILRNRSPIVSVENVTPYERFYGRKPDVSHLKVFGCHTYMHIPKEDRKKWDPKSKKRIFIGYILHNKGYRLYLLLQDIQKYATDCMILRENKFMNHEMSYLLKMNLGIVCKRRKQMFRIRKHLLSLNKVLALKKKQKIQRILMICKSILVQMKMLIRMMKLSAFQDVQIV